MKMNIKLLRTNYLAIIWSIIVFVLCTLPSENLPKANDKIAHFGVFAIFAILWLFANKNWAWVIAASFIFGMLIEFWQGILPISFHRSFDWYDMLADGLGGIIGWLVWWLLLRKIDI